MQSMPPAAVDADCVVTCFMPGLRHCKCVTPKDTLASTLQRNTKRNLKRKERENCLMNQGATAATTATTAAAGVSEFV